MYAKVAPAVALSALLVASTATHAGDPDRGAEVFRKCAACHSLEQGKKKVGPSLHGLFGRTSGTEPGFNYSKAMREAEVVWSDDTLDLYLANPRKFIPKNRMPFAGLKAEDDRDDLITYLRAATR